MTLDKACGSQRGCHGVEGVVTKVLIEVAYALSGQQFASTRQAGSCGLRRRHRAVPGDKGGKRVHLK
jgi:hypothetical protein